MGHKSPRFARFMSSLFKVKSSTEAACSRCLACFLIFKAGLPGRRNRFKGPKAVCDFEVAKSQFASRVNPFCVSQYVSKLVTYSKLGMVWILRSDS